MALPASDDDDILNILENSPTLKGLLDLPARVAALEAKVLKLEESSASAPVLRPGAKPCPFCGGSLKLTAEVPHPQLGVVGLKVRTFQCEYCGKVTKRDYDPRTDGS